MQPVARRSAARPTLGLELAARSVVAVAVVAGLGLAVTAGPDVVGDAFVRLAALVPASPEGGPGPWWETAPMRIGLAVVATVVGLPLLVGTLITRRAPGRRSGQPRHRRGRRGTSRGARP